jgi:hypothetical protein
MGILECGSPPGQVGIVDMREEVGGESGDQKPKYIRAGKGTLRTCKQRKDEIKPILKLYDSNRTEKDSRVTAKSPSAQERSISYKEVKKCESR